MHLVPNWSEHLIFVGREGGRDRYYQEKIAMTSIQTKKITYTVCLFVVLEFNDTSTFMGHFVSSPRERETRDRRDSRGVERKGQGRRRKMNESEETEEVFVVVVRIFNATRHPRHIEAAAIVMCMCLYSLAFMDHPCTLGAAVCHQAPPCPLYTQPRARQV